MLKLFIPLLFLLVVQNVLAQSNSGWENNLKQKNANFFETKKHFDEYWQDKEITKSCGYKPFMRLAYWIEPRVFPSGDVSLASPLKAYNEYQKYLQENTALSSTACQGNWSSVGPIMLNDTLLWSKKRIGRINCIAVNPNDSQNFYVGAPAGGLWKTIDGGTSYVNYTDNLDYFGFSTVAIAATNTNILYAGTGDRYGHDMPTLGLIKSIDAGLTWQHVSTFPNYEISKILINPLDEQSILVSTNSGIFKSNDGGLSWTSTLTTLSFRDLEYRPGDSTTIYTTTSSNFYKSTDGGLSFNLITGTGIVYTSLHDALIAVSESDPDFVAVATATTGNDIMVYSSTNLGTSFSNNGMTLIIENQAWYNFSFAVSPTNSSEILVGAVRLRVSTDGGASFIYSFLDNLHADIHDIVYSADGSSIYACTDGGIFKGNSPGFVFQQYNGNMDISQIYSLGVSKTTAGKVVVGLQDNGSKFVNGIAQTWTGFGGGDGMECFFDPTNDQIIYYSSQIGTVYKTTNNGASGTSIMNGMPSGGTLWQTPWGMDPNNASTLYCARGNNFYKSANAGASWSLYSSFPGASLCREFAVAANNSLIIYALVGWSIHKSNDGGLNWTALSFSVAGDAQYVTVNPLDSNDVIVCMTGTGIGNTVFRTLDGGINWTNISAGLPNVAANVAVFALNPADGFYVGTDVGIFYYDQASGNYLPFNQGLPFVPVTEMEIDILGNKLYATTYGRGLWKADLLNTSTCPPIANFDIVMPACGLFQVNFSNTSFLNPTTYSWTFPGGSPASSAAANPTVNYPGNGTYSATLIASNAFGADTSFYTFAIGGLTNFPITEDFAGAAFPPSDWTRNSNSVDAFNWEKNNTYGGFGQSSKSMFFNNWSYNSLGAKHHIISPLLNPTNASNLILSFDLAHHRFGSSSDSLLVSISTDCGISWTEVYAKGSSGLETASLGGSHPFNPTATEWRRDSISLNINTVTSLLFRFTNVGDYGDRIYVDNINLNGVFITGFEPLQEALSFKLFPNPTHDFMNIQIQDRNHPFLLFNLLGETLMMKNEVPETINLSHLAAGVYIVQIGGISKRVIKK